MKWPIRQRRHHLGLLKPALIVGGGILLARKLVPELRRYIRMERM